LYIGSASRSIVEVAVRRQQHDAALVLGSKPANAWYPPVPARLRQ